jgi:hypothetical protein
LGVGEGADEVQAVRGEGDAGKEGDYFRGGFSYVVWSLGGVGKGKKRTRLGEVEALFAEVRDEAEEGDPAPEHAEDDVEVGDGESRHFGRLVATAAS